MYPNAARSHLLRSRDDRLDGSLIARGSRGRDEARRVRQLGRVLVKLVRFVGEVHVAVRRAWSNTAES